MPTPSAILPGMVTAGIWLVVIGLLALLGEVTLGEDARALIGGRYG